MTGGGLVGSCKVRGTQVLTKDNQLHLLHCLPTPVASFSLTVTQTLRSAALEDCALCQETVSSSELAAKTRDGDFEGMWDSLVCGPDMLSAEQKDYFVHVHLDIRPFMDTASHWRWSPTLYLLLSTRCIQPLYCYVTLGLLFSSSAW